jgi:TPR repeat protein
VEAITDLALTLSEGIQDRNGRSLVRRNPVRAVQLLRRAAEQGDVTGQGALGYAYDVGQGVRRDTRLALRWYRSASRQGSTVAMANIATVYRDQGKLALAHRWLLRAVAAGDGDAMVAAGYGLLHGIGVGRNIVKGRLLLRRAVRSRYISAYGREEALYLLAVSFIDARRPRVAVPLLRRAAADGDYPEAALALLQVRAGGEVVPCRCRRHLKKTLKGHAKCGMHGR